MKPLDLPLNREQRRLLNNQKPPKLPMRFKNQNAAVQTKRRVTVYSLGSKLDIKIKNHNALQECIDGALTFINIDAVVGALNVSEALMQLQIGDEYLPELQSAQAVVYETVLNKRTALTTEAKEALTLAIEIHDAQLDDPRTTSAMLLKAIKLVKKQVNAKSTTTMNVIK